MADLNAASSRPSMSLAIVDPHDKVLRLSNRPTEEFSVVVTACILTIQTIKWLKYLNIVAHLNLKRNIIVSARQPSETLKQMQGNFITWLEKKNTFNISFFHAFIV